jgi:hypothetical protein
MTHIVGTVAWNKAIFYGFFIRDNETILLLADGTYRKMNLINWEDSYPLTLKNLFLLKSGDNIQYGTWNGYESKIWFCDVRRI